MKISITTATLLFCILAAVSTAAERRPATGIAAVPGTSQTVRVAGILLKWVGPDKEANFRRVEPLIREAAATGARIVCTTEVFLNGHSLVETGLTRSMTLDEFNRQREAIPTGGYYRRLASLAAELKIHLAAGMLEVDGDNTHNTAVLIGPEGQLVGRYRKQYMMTPDNEFCVPGTESSVFETPYGRVGMLICADRTNVEVVRGYRENGADFLICLSGGSYGTGNNQVLQVRSKENQLPLVFVHPSDFTVIGADGELLAIGTFGDPDRRRKQAREQKEQTLDHLYLKPEQVGFEKDIMRVFYYDLPVTRKTATSEIASKP